ncbi:TniQ family protein [Paraburkholderia tropica]|uniref:TniQ family protein n=1 Tax=Paraburkholderia tropica TaxID=92647 RepID=UPI00244652DC|nr:TniQ family protein [Paraburkholderia tropica]
MSGTWQQERMSSYFNRLAEDVCLSVRTLLAEVIAAEIGVSNLVPGKILSYVDSAAPASIRLIAAVERLTGLENMRRLTLCSVDVFCSTADDHRTSAAYCPICLEEALTRLGCCFTPLVWALKSYQICIAHRVPLASQCPYCGNDKLRSLYGGSRNGCCHNCRRWLGKAAADGLRETDPKLLELSLCAAEIVAFASSEAKKVDAWSLVTGILHSRMDGNISLLCRAMSTSIERVVRIVVYKARPSVSEWMALSNLARCSVSDLLAGDALPNVSLPSRNIKLADLAKEFGKIVNGLSRSDAGCTESIDLLEDALI